MEDQRETRRLRAACEGGQGRRDDDPMETPGRLTPAGFIALFDGSNITRRLRCSQSSQTASQPQLVAGKRHLIRYRNFTSLRNVIISHVLFYSSELSWSPDAAQSS